MLSNDPMKQQKWKKTIDISMNINEYDLSIFWVQRTILLNQQKMFTKKKNLKFDFGRTFLFPIFFYLIKVTYLDIGNS